MFEKDVDLKKLSNYKIGGKADYFASVGATEELIEVIKEAKEKNLDIFILGGGTNVLIGDDGFRGLVIKPNFLSLTNDGDELKVGAGVTIKDLLNFCIDNSLSGLEWAGGLPGTVGGAIFGNAGAFGGEMKDNVAKVVSVNVDEGEPKVLERNNEECKFGYRDSVFKKLAQTGKREIITEIEFDLELGEKREIETKIQEKIDYRQAKQPLEYPNIGSMFKNVKWDTLPEEVQARFLEKKKNDPFPVLPVAVLIDAAGLKGSKEGGAQVSEKHPNFIVNVDSASSADVKALVDKVQNKIKAEFGVELDREVIFL
ncbi:MAG: UDP-N-acetylenolpyruvoylglucosamine reductase [Candidatus Harrisonbacteria bacterium CG10_big_fil_rev_8_21_14_0_10_44_23]|uniref:UDP-N-acetylenolpyruvoylglucosamine reductase n=1 Tax=Candidatus Harrisonbacteria bacterium CG10_big_fil_rev_8_21_14_0_10_44_23 TaxID=1974585 RepID=A0A2H0UPY4_9BACT|nr:MAG: UDP-N-acetylenolpyruvoylglucosamine reductase [Candidatus Harrisonbacteria bacterium CG10_big_fil_rev_8_21_14_0_10_44_23]